MKIHVQRLSLLMLAAIVVGCGGSDYPGMGWVSGTVTMDEKPLANATIVFAPNDGTRQSAGVTDENGYYELTYSMSTEGAKATEHTVEISTYRPPGPDVNGDFAVAVPDTVPMKYNTKSELKQVVEEGSQTINFELSSDGEIDPREDDANTTEDDF